MNRTINTLRNWIDACSASPYLTEWEEEFIESIERQLNEKGTLSIAQEETLERIYAQRTR